MVIPGASARGLGAVVLGLSLSVAAPASAGKKLTTTLVRSPSGGAVACNAVNAGRKPLEVVFRIRDLAGEILVESGVHVLGPGEANGIGDGGNDDYYGYCEFEVLRGRTKDLRGSLELRRDENQTGADVVVPAY